MTWARASRNRYTPGASGTARSRRFIASSWDTATRSIVGRPQRDVAGGPAGIWWHLFAVGRLIPCEHAIRQPAPSTASPAAADSNRRPGERSLHLCALHRPDAAAVIDQYRRGGGE